MKKLFLSFAAAVTAAGLTGCYVSYDNCAVTGDDSRMDEENGVFVRQAIQAYNERKEFRCDLELKPAESVGIFLSNSDQQFSVSDKRNMIMLLENTLAAQLSALRDFNIVNRGNTAGSSEVSVAVAGQTVKNYVMTYSITKLAFREQTRSEFVNNRTVKTKYYTPVAKVEVCLYDPEGNTVFAFNQECSSGESESRDKSLLNDVVENAARMVVEQYSIATAPPCYVRQTTGGGTYVQISAGSAYGIRPNMKIRFYRNIVRQLPSPDGGKPEATVHQQTVGTGVVGVHGAPVGSDDAWVYLDGGFLSPCDFRDPKSQSKRTVFVWTSAKPE